MSTGVIEILITLVTSDILSWSFACAVDLLAIASDTPAVTSAGVTLLALVLSSGCTLRLVGAQTSATCGQIHMAWTCGSICW